MRLFLTGTDTGVGKTFVAVRLVRTLRALGADAVGLKPICCGGREDAEALVAASGGAVTLDEVNPFWLRTPAAPYTAAMIENRPVDLALVRKAVEQMCAAHASVIVEGVGGWRVPIARDYFVSDLASDIGLPVAVVVANRLGALNHTLLTLEAIRAAGLPLAGLIINQAQPGNPDEEIAIQTNTAVLEELAGAPVLFHVGHGQSEFASTFPSTIIQGTG